MKQAKFIPQLGFIQVQISNSMFYLSLVNTLMLGLTFWYTSGSIIAAKYAPWFTLYMFLTFGVIITVLMMLFDWKVMYPSRQGVLNKQAYKHVNPAVADLQKILKNQERIMKKLGIKGK